MKANEFVKKFGVERAKQIVNADDSVHALVFATTKVSFLDLKRLVESHELVESYKGLHCAKNTLGLLQSSMEIGLYHGMDGVDAATEIPRLKQAIADIEACKEVS
jgi:hypothetical protein